jgi:hypothetical protein
VPSFCPSCLSLTHRAVCGLCAEEDVRHTIRGNPLAVGEHMGIATGHVDAGVPQHGSGGCEVDVSGQQCRGGRVAKIMQPPFGNASHTAQPLEVSDVVARINRLSDLSGNDPVAIDPNWCSEPLSGLDGPVGSQLRR